MHCNILRTTSRCKKKSPWTGIEREVACLATIVNKRNVKFVFVVVQFSVSQWNSHSCSTRVSRTVVFSRVSALSEKPLVLALTEQSLLGFTKWSDDLLFINVHDTWTLGWHHTSSMEACCVFSVLLRLKKLQIWMQHCCYPWDSKSVLRTLTLHHPSMGIVVSR